MGLHVKEILLKNEPHFQTAAALCESVFTTYTYTLIFSSTEWKTFKKVSIFDIFQLVFNI